ncbi:MAG: putative sulfate/molybdate transporter [Dehalococcoidales bacterium]
MRVNSFRFNLQELGGALGDLGTLLPLMVALILINGLNATSVLVGVGLFYIASGLYYRIPMPVQPLKAVSAIAISLGISASVIGAAGLLMGAILLLLSLTNLIAVVVKLFPRPVVRGIQLSIGLILFRKGIELAFSKQIFISGTSHSLGLGQFPIGILLAVLALAIFILFKFFIKQSQRFPPSLALLTFGLGAGIVFSPISGLDKLSYAFPSIALPSAADFWLALTVLVIPQLPLTLGNAVVGAWDTAHTYFQDQARRVSPRALTASMGLANIAAGLFGAMPMCHGSGGLTAHYRLGARTGAASLMVGGLLLTLGILLGSAALSFLSLIPLSVLGVLLAIVGIYHAFLIRDLTARRQLAVAGTVAVVTILLGNLAFGFAAGIVLHHILRLSARAAGQRFSCPAKSGQ